MSAFDPVQNYIDENRQRFREELFDLLKIPSISTDRERKEDLRKAARFLLEQLEGLEMDRVELFETENHPILFAEKKVDADLPTVLIYGHYDVQPPDPLEEWVTPPFEPAIRGERVYARGASDDKGQLYTHIKAAEAWIRAGNGLPVNLKFLLEGEEEIGSPNLVPFIRFHKELLECDMVLISDTAMIAEDQPSITYGLRGLAYMELEVEGPERDLHSGVYGGGVANPANVLAEILAGMKDEKGRILIEGFYDDVLPLTDEERDQFRKLPHNDEEWRKELGIPMTHGEEGFTTLERITSRPTLDVNGIWGGYQGEGAKTVLPARAGAKVSMRLVPDQDPGRVAELFRRHVERVAPPTVRVTVKEHHGGHPVVIDRNFPGMKAAAAAFEKVYGKEVLFSREGGSIPVVADFKKTLGVESILMGFGLAKDALHSPNESFSLRDFQRGIHTSALFMGTLAEMHGK